MPEHAMLALGALSSLASTSKVAPAKKAALDAIDELGRARPDIQLPPPELVAEAVAKMQAEHDEKVAALEAEEREAEEEAAKAKADEAAAKAARIDKAEARKAKLASVNEGDEDAPIIEEDDDDDEDGLEVI